MSKKDVKEFLELLLDVITDDDGIRIDNDETDRDAFAVNQHRLERAIRRRIEKLSWEDS